MRPVVAAMLALVAACGSTSAAGDGPTTATSAPATTAEVTTTGEPPITGASASTDDATTTTDGPTTTLGEAAAVETLADGRPATFVAITDDYQAVEVDTLTGEVLRSFGQTGTSADFGASGEISPNALDGVWRSADGSVTFVSDCCEPAAGAIYLLGRGDRVSADNRSDLDMQFGWWASPAIAGQRFAILNEAIVITEPGRADPIFSAWIPDVFGTWAVTNAAWSRDGTTVSWIGEDGDKSAYLHSVGLDAEEPIEATVPLPIGGSGVAIDGLATQASGNLVTFTHATIGPGETTESVGVVLSPEGDLVARFPVEGGSTLGGYDPSGRFLIYVDARGTVRWQGVGQTGWLGDGYLFASW